MDEPITLRVLGGSALFDPVRAAHVTVESGRIALLLAILADSPDVLLSRADLGRMIWPEFHPDQQANNLRVALHEVRELLDPTARREGGPVEIDRHYVRLRAGTLVADTAQFTQSARLALATTDHDLRLKRLAAATALYTGPFLPESPLVAVIERRRELDDLYHTALVELVDLARATSVQAEHRGAFVRLLAGDPLNHEAHAGLLESLVQAGAQVRAVRHLVAMRALWQARLGVDPPDELLALAARLGLFEADPEALAPPGIPLGYGRVFGREAAIACCEGLLSGPEGRLLTLVGVGGVGKTHLAVEIARRSLQSLDMPDRFRARAHTTETQINGPIRLVGTPHHGNYHSRGGGLHSRVLQPGNHAVAEANR